MTDKPNEACPPQTWFPQWCLAQQQKASRDRFCLPESIQALISHSLIIHNFFRAHYIVNSGIFCSAVCHRQCSALLCPVTRDLLLNHGSTIFTSSSNFPHHQWSQALTNGYRGTLKTELFLLCQFLRLPGKTSHWFPAGFAIPGTTLSRQSHSAEPRLQWRFPKGQVGFRLLTISVQEGWGFYLADHRIKYSEQWIKLRWVMGRVLGSNELTDLKLIIEILHWAYPHFGKSVFNLDES